MVHLFVGLALPGLFCFGQPCPACPALVLPLSCPYPAGKSWEGKNKMLFAGLEKFQTFRNRKNTFYGSFESCCPANGCLLNSANGLGAGQEQDKSQDKPVLSAKTAKTAPKARRADPCKDRPSNPADTASEGAAKWREASVWHAWSCRQFASTGGNSAATLAAFGQSSQLFSRKGSNRVANLAKNLDVTVAIPAS